MYPGFSVLVAKLELYTHCEFQRAIFSLFVSWERTCLRVETADHHPSQGRWRRRPRALQKNPGPVLGSDQSLERIGAGACGLTTRAQSGPNGLGGSDVLTMPVWIQHLARARMIRHLLHVCDHERLRKGSRGFRGCPDIQFVEATTGRSVRARNTLRGRCRGE